MSKTVDFEMERFYRFYTDYIADNVSVLVTVDGAPLAGAQIEVTGSPLRSHEENFIAYTGTADGNGVMSLPHEPYAIDPVVLARSPSLVY